MVPLDEMTMINMQPCLECEKITKIGYLNGRFVRDLNEQIASLKSQIGEPLIEARNNDNVKESIKLLFASMGMVAGGFILINVLLIATRMPLREYVLNVIPILGCIFLPAFSYRIYTEGKRKYMEIKDTNNQLRQTINAISIFVSDLEDFCSSCPVDVEKLEKSYTGCGFMSTDVIKSLSFKQLIDVYTKYRDDVICEVISGKLDKQKLEYIEILVKGCEEEKDQYTFILTLQRLIEDVFLQEPELFDDYIRDLPDKIRNDNNVLAVINDFYESSKLNIGQGKKLVKIKLGKEEFSISEEQLNHCQYFSGKNHFSGSWGKSEQGEIIELNVEKIENIENFVEMMRILDTGKLDLTIEEIPGMLDTADFYGNSPVIELCQIELLKKLDEDFHSELTEEGWELLKQILLTGADYTNIVKHRIKALFEKMVNSALIENDLGEAEKLFEFAGNYRALEPFLQNFDPKVEDIVAKIRLVEMAFKFNLTTFQEEIKREISNNLANDYKIVALLRDYFDSPKVFEYIRELATCRIHEFFIKELWDFAQEKKDTMLINACLDCAKKYPRSLDNIWSFNNIPGPLAMVLLNIN